MQYTYKIISTNPEARHMEVEFSAEGYPTVLVGTRLPLKGESLDDILRLYAPIQYWNEQISEVTVPEVGSSGSIKEAEIITPTTNPVVVDSGLSSAIIEAAVQRALLLKDPSIV
jgi:hypothetical protein